MSQLFVKEITDEENTSCDEELYESKALDNEEYYKQIAASRDKVDIRLLEIYMLAKASE